MIMTSHVKNEQAGPDLVESRIVVGVDGSSFSMRALEWAATEAELRGVALQVVHVDFARHAALEALAPGMLRAEQSVLDQAVVRARALAPGIVVAGRLCEPPAGQALIEASAGAEMLVVGSRGLTGLREWTLGSVSSECAHHAVCPVVIFRPPTRQPAAEARKALVGVSNANGGLSGGAG